MKIFGHIHGHIQVAPQERIPGWAGRVIFHFVRYHRYESTILYVLHTLPDGCCSGAGLHGSRVIRGVQVVFSRVAPRCAVLVLPLGSGQVLGRCVERFGGARTITTDFRLRLAWPHRGALASSSWQISAAAQCERQTVHHASPLDLAAARCRPERGAHHRPSRPRC